MIIGLIPNLLAPLFVLQEKKRKRKKKGKKKRGILGAACAAWGLRSVSVPKGLALEASPQGFVVPCKESPGHWQLL